MIKYCFITDEETGLVQLGVGCPDEYYEEIGMQQRDVEQSEIDYQWYLSDKCPHYTIEEKFNIAKHNKIVENNEKAKEFRYNQTFTVEVQGQECVFDTSDETQRDLNTATDYCLATGKTYNNWTTNNGVVLNLTIEDINIIFEEFKQQADVYAKWLEYDTAIESAETIEQLDEIEINYDRDDT